MASFSYILVFLVSYGCLCATEFTCDPVVDCAAAAPGDEVPDPADCHFRYYCTSNLEPSPTSFECPTDEHFDFTSGACIAGAECGEEGCPSTTTEGSTGSVNTCSVICKLETDLIPYPGDCTQYYDCSEDVTGPQACSSDTPYFNGVECVVDVNECCEVCQDECNTDTEFMLIPDPANCNGYIFCGVDTNTCSDGDYFNVETLECEAESEPCTSYCPAATSTDTTTPGFTETSTNTDTTKESSVAYDSTLSSTFTEDTTASSISMETTSASSISMETTSASSIGMETTSAASISMETTRASSSMTEDSTTVVTAVESTNTAPSAQKYTCDPSTDCAAGTPGMFVPDPDDCLSYYICTSSLEPIPSSLSCPAGEHFDSTVYPGECVAGEECGNDACTLPNTCTTKCSSEVSYIPYPGDCSMFYRCDDPNDDVGVCQEDKPYFNGDTCVDDPAECCVICTPECEADFEVVLDPANCNSYYLCYEGSLDCPAGEFFDPVSYTCTEETSACNAYCSDSNPSTANPITTSTTISESTSSELTKTKSPATEPATTELSTTEPSTTEPSTTNPTTTETTTTTEPTTTDLIGTCVENIECTSTDDVVSCYVCTDTYYDCGTGVPILQTCSETFVFDYTVGFCVPIEECPYFP